jgi:hypothetical protein
MFDRGMAGRQRAFRHDVAGFLGDVRQPPFIVLFGAGGGGIDIRGSRVLYGSLGRVLSRLLRRQIRSSRPSFGTAPRRPWAGLLGVIGLVAIHGPKLSAAVGHRQRAER